MAVAIGLVAVLAAALLLFVLPKNDAAQTAANDTPAVTAALTPAPTPAPTAAFSPTADLRSAAYAVAEVLLADGQYEKAARSFSTACGYGDALLRAWNIRYQYQRFGQIASNASCTVCLRRTGTAAASGDNSDGQCNVEDWENLVALAAGARHMAGLRADGTAIAVGYNAPGSCNVRDWADIGCPLTLK